MTYQLDKFIYFLSIPIAFYVIYKFVICDILKNRDVVLTDFTAFLFSIIPMVNVTIALVFILKLIFNYSNKTVLIKKKIENNLKIEKSFGDYPGPG